MPSTKTRHGGRRAPYRSSREKHSAFRRRWRDYGRPTALARELRHHFKWHRLKRRAGQASAHRLLRGTCCQTPTGCNSCFVVAAAKPLEGTPNEWRLRSAHRKRDLFSVRTNRQWPPPSSCGTSSGTPARIPGQHLDVRTPLKQFRGTHQVG